MPELSRFFGIIIRMYVEAGGPHHLPHFHAYYQDEVAVVGLEPIELMQEACRDGNVGWLRRGPNFIKRNCSQIGGVCRVASRRCRSRRWSET